jgi:hypothetical protein
MSQMATMFRHHHDTDADLHSDDLGMRDRLHVPRSRGATSGLLLVLLGLWGGLVPFIGPSLGFAFTPDNAWDFTWGRFWLEIVPAAATVLGGLWLMGSSNRISGWVGGWVAAAGGAWFVIGQEVSRLWNDGTFAAGNPTATTNLGHVAEWIGYFLGLGTVIVFLSAFALGRMSVVGVRDVRLVRQRRYADTATPAAPVATTDETAAHRRPVVTDDDRTQTTDS